MIIKSEYIRRKLSYVKSIVEDDTKQKLYDINKTAEDIFMNILNNVYGWQLVNANNIRANFPAIDLIDTTNKIVIQITSETSADKVRKDTIEKFQKLVEEDEYKKYANYKIKIFYIKDKPNLKKTTLEKFAKKGVPKSHLLGIEDINREISSNPDIANRVFKTLCKIFHDNICNYDISPKLTIKSSTYNSRFIGREDEIKAIDKILDSSNSLLLINGIGGIGKSSLANYYLYIREKEFDYYGFIEGLGSFVSEFRNSLDLKSEKENDLQREIIYKLQKIEGKKLLVIDNVEDIEANKELIEMILSLSKFNYKILFTSRRKIKNINSYYLGTLLPTDAQKLFLSYYQTNEIEKVNKIIDYLGLHTLFIKLVAETVENNGYSLDDILAKFKNGELSKIEFIDEESGDEVTFNHNLQELFSMQNLKDEYILLLKQLAVLPSIDIELSFLEEILGKERLKGRLNFLVSRGWLIENKGSYKLHQIIKEFVLANYMPSFEEIKGVVEYFQLFVENCAEKMILIDMKKYSIYFLSIIIILEKLKIKNTYLTYFYNLMGRMYYSSGIYSESLIFFIKELKIKKNLFGEKHFDIALTYNDIAGVYREIQKIDMAKKLYLEALTIILDIPEKLEKGIGIYANLAEVYVMEGKYNEASDIYEEIIFFQEKEEDYNLLIMYNNIFRLYSRMAEKEKALLFSTKVLNLSDKIISKNHPFKSDIYSTMAEFYENIQEYEKALTFILKAIEITKETKSINHPTMSNNYNLLGGIYVSMKKYNKAFYFYKKSLEIRKKISGEYHSETATTYNDLGFLYSLTYKQDKALEFHQKSLKIRKKIFDENHIQIAQSYKNIGSYFLQKNMLKKSLSFINKALVIEEKVLPKNHPQLIETQIIINMLNPYNIINLEKKPKRNDPCPCNSGKKYKKCCGKPK